MPVSGDANTIYRFGPFEVNAASGELLKQGVRVKLQEHPFRLLVILLENAGELVSHGDIQCQIWENNTFVEFDSGLRVAVRKLRDALSDDADNPHYIETIPRKGYRFLGPVVRVKSSDSEKMLIGQIISHYRLIGKVGSGGMGVVYEAEDIRLGRRVALKFLPENLVRDQRALQRFAREARAVSSLNHPSICTLYEVEEHDSQPVIVMELLDGESLKDRIRKGPISGDELLDIGIQISEGLEAAHAKGIIHRDIKPGNIFIIAAGRVKILDFGLAKVLPGDAPEDESEEESLTLEGVIPGTTSYLSPEQVRGEEVDARSDLFSLGVVLYEMATGQRPFGGKNRVLLMEAILNAKAAAPSRANPALPAVLDSIIARSLEKKREHRYQRPADLCADLKRVKQEKESGQPTIASAPPAAKAKAQIARRWKVAMASGAAAIAITGGAFFYLRRAPALTEKDTIILSDFDNKTGDPVFDGTLRQGMAVQLEQSPFLSLVSEERIQRTLRLMGQPPGARLTPEVARDLCQRTASAAVLDGSIASLGSQYVLGLQAVNCRTGDSLAQAQVTADGKERVLKALGEAAAKLRNRLGESLSTVQNFDTPVEQATTPSLEALQAYSLGRQTFVGKGNSAAAVPLFQRAIRLDPNFAMAYALLGMSYGDLGEPSLGAENTRKAYELRERVSEREKFYIESHYYDLVSGDLEKARQVYELWAQTYPRDDVPPNNLGVISFKFGQYDKALAQYREAFSLSSDGMSYAILVRSYLFLNRVEEARATAEEAQANKLDSPFLRFYLYQLAFLKNDAAEMAQQVAWAAGKPGVEDVLLANEANTAAYSGRLGKARELSGRAVASAERAEEKETAASYEGEAAVQEALFGNTAEARQRAAAALGLSTGRNVQYGAALALALAGDAARAQALADDLAKRFPEDTLVKFDYLPTIHAQLALSRNDSSKAIEALRAAAPYELGSGQLVTILFRSALYSVYVRGGTYLAAHRGSEAAAEFQKILDHRSVVLNEPTGALAHLGLARAYALQGDTTKARAAYNDFLTLWKSADPRIPILQHAKAEYAKLQ